MTIREALAQGSEVLKSPSFSALIDTPALDASILLAEIFKVSRTELFARGNEPITAAAWENFTGLLERRRLGECIAYIIGRKEFRGLMFTVNPSVLVPRPDTETLAEAALEYISALSLPGIHKPASSECTRTLLDLCTGSGAVAISLKNECSSLIVTASDISPEALEVAALNAACLINREPIQFIQSDLFENIPGKFNIIVSNPPYVSSGELASMAPEVLWEPSLALDGGEDGLSIIKNIIFLAPEHLYSGGILLLEAGPEQMQKIEELFEKRGFKNVKIHKDLAGRERVISAIA